MDCLNTNNYNKVYQKFSLSHTQYWPWPQAYGLVKHTVCYKPITEVLVLHSVPSNCLLLLLSISVFLLFSFSVFTLF